MISRAARVRAVLTRAGTPSGLVPAGLVAWLLATGRWGSYVGVPDQPIYLSELAVASFAVLAAIEHRRRQRPPDTAEATPSHLSWILLLALLGWAILRLLTGSSAGVDALRDFAPYGYAVIAVALALRPPRPEVAVRVLLGAFVAHTAWVTAAHYALLPAGLPALGRTHLFEIRADFDGTVCGVTAAWCVYLAVQNRERRSWAGGLLVFAAFNLLLVFNLLSRGGLIATFASFFVLGLAVAGPMLGLARASLRNAAIAALVIAAFLGGSAVSLATSATGDRLLSTFDFDDDSGATGGGAAAAGGTTKARLEVYDRVIRYSATPQRLAVGVGFGPDFLEASGAAPVLEGTTFTGVRAPHNILVNSLARLGLLGMLLHLGVLIMGGRMAARFFLRGGNDPLTAVCAVLVVALPVAALVGVILESPFGAIPYFWCFGWLAMRPVAPRSRRGIGAAHGTARESGDLPRRNTAADAGLQESRQS